MRPIVLLVLLSLAAEARGVVVSVSPPADRVGKQILAEGGNAVDAAVAVGFALAVTWPEAGNIGGGGFMLVRPAGPNIRPVVIDYRETAPASATKDLFAKGVGSAHRTVGVPGSVAGLAMAHAKFGKLPWNGLVAPAVKLAEEGFVIDDALAGSLNAGLAKTKGFAEFRLVFGKSKGEWAAGDRLVQKDLAKTLGRIADEGADGFYKGPTAERLVEEMKAGGGLLTRKDLAAYRAKSREPIHGTYRGYDIYGPPPPSSGGICLVQMLNVLETFDLRKSPRYSARTLHLMTESMRRAYCDRARHLGDEEFVAIPAHLTSKEYAKKLAAGISLDKATPSADIAKDILLTDTKSHTTHYSVIDAAGMAVSTTTTLEDSFGSKVVVRGAGFLLNNEMTDFNPRPGITTRTGLVGTPANQIAPGKRMLSSMTPVIVCRDGRVVLVTGSPGGRTIINTVLCVVLNVLEYDMPLREALDAPRMHMQWFPDRVQLEAGVFDKYPKGVEELEAMGHKVTKVRVQGDAHSIWFDPKAKAFRGEHDPRRTGRAAEFGKP